jgi:hypothetical protein
MIKTNMDHTKPLEMKEKKGMDGKKIFPFWTPVTNDGIETYASYDEYLSEKDKKLRSMELGDKTGIVKSASEFKTVGTDSTKETNIDYEDNSIMSIMKKFVKQINGEKDEDNTGIVKPKAEFKTTVKNGDNVKTTTVELATPNIPKMPEQAIKNTTDTVVKIDSNAANPKGDLVGIVKPKAEVTTSVTKSNGVTTTVKQEIGVPIIKMEKGQIIDLNASAKVTVDSKAANPKGDLVGIVKAKDAFEKQNIPSDIMKTQKNVDVTNKTTGLDAKTTTSNKVPVNPPKMNPVLGDKTGIVKPKAEMSTQVTHMNGITKKETYELGVAVTKTNNKVEQKDFTKMGIELGDKTGAVKPKSEVKAEPKSIKFTEKK